MAKPSLGVVEVRLHFRNVAFSSHSTKGNEGVAYRKKGEVGAGGVHRGRRGGDTEELTLKRLKNILRLLHGCLVLYNAPFKKLNEKYLSRAYSTLRLTYLIKIFPKQGLLNINAVI